MDLEHATAAARTVKANGQEWHVSPLTAREWGEFQSWLKDEYLELIQRNAEKIKDKDVRAKVVSDAFARVARFSMDAPELASLANSPAGLYRLVRLHLLRRHPEVTEEDVANILNSAEVQSLFLKRINDSLGPAGGRKKKRAKRTKKRVKRRVKKGR